MWHEARREKSQPAIEGKTDQVPNRWWDYWPLLAGAVLVYAFCAWGFVRPGAYVPFVIPVDGVVSTHDHVYYTRIAYFNMISGSESDTFFLNFLDTAYQGNKPYHYLELWLTNVVAVVTGRRQVEVLQLVTYAFFYWLGFVGLLALWERENGRVGLLAFFVVCILLFVAGFNFDFYQSIQFISQLGNYRYPLIGELWPKLSIIHVFFLVGFLLARGQQWVLLVLVLFVMSISSMSVFPAAVLTIHFGAVLVYLFNPKYRLLAIKCFGCALILTLGFLLFYALTDTSQIGRGGSNTQDVFKLLASLSDPSALRTRFNILVGTPLQVAVVYLPFALLGCLYWRKWWLSWGDFDFTLIAPMVLLLFCSNLAWAIFFKQLNANQLFYNVAIPTINLTIYSFGLWIARQAFDWRTVIAAILFVCSSAKSLYKSYTVFAKHTITTGFSESYLRSINNYLEYQQVSWQGGASLKSLDYYYLTHSKYVTIYVNGDYLPYLGNGGAVSVSLNDVDIPLSGTPLERARDQQAVSMGLFYRWVAREKAAGTFRDVPTSQLAFVRHYGLKFLIISKGVEVPATLRPLVTEEFADELSGERFLVLDPKK
jgi:hypothetical protein